MFYLKEYKKLNNVKKLKRNLKFEKTVNRLNKNKY